MEQHEHDATKWLRPRTRRTRVSSPHHHRDGLRSEVVLGQPRACGPCAHPVTRLRSVCADFHGHMHTEVVWMLEYLKEFLSISRVLLRSQIGQRKISAGFKIRASDYMLIWPWPTLLSPLPANLAPQPPRAYPRASASPRAAGSLWLRDKTRAYPALCFDSGRWVKTKAKRGCWHKKLAEGIRRAGRARLGGRRACGAPGATSGAWELQHPLVPAAERSEPGRAQSTVVLEGGGGLGDNGRSRGTSESKIGERGRAVVLVATGVAYLSAMFQFYMGPPGAQASNVAIGSTWEDQGIPPPTSARSVGHFRRSY
ncbi:hypothetical protein DFH09DRAFT_1087659 [Mycena vulgaris]|nr:hypothetical protein DFH09DRAFT_1087659 [Mycena vulgaris]